MDSEQVIFELICLAGSARSDAFEAYNAAVEGDFDKAKASIDAAKENLLQAHHVQTGLIQEEAAGNHMEVQLLMVHAQDHLMTSILAKDLIETMINMQKEIQELKKMIK